MACQYKTKNGEVIGDIYKLIEHIDNKDISEFTGISDIIFSKNEKQEGLINLIKAIREDYLKRYKEEESISARTESKFEDELGNPNGVSAQEIIDDPRCIVDGKPIVAPYVEEDYINKEALNILEKEGWGSDKEEQAKDIVRKKLENYEKVRDMSVTLHKLIDSGYIRGDASVFVKEMQEKIKGTAFEGKNEILKSLSQLIHTFLKGLKAPEMYGSDSSIMGNIGVKAKAFNTDIFGHIDYIAIDTQGNLHMYVFKASTEPYSKWSEQKKEKYKYYLAFLKLMLKQNGVNVRNMDLNIVPVLLNTDENCDILKSIYISKEPVNISSSGSITKYDKHASFFIQSESTPISVSNEDFRKANELCSFIAPNANLLEDGLHNSVEKLIYSAPESGEAEPYTINRLSEGNWRIVINGKEYITKSTKPKNSNSEIREIFEKHVRELIDGKLQVIQSLKTAIINMSKEQNPNTLNKIGRNKGLAAHSIFILRALQQYTSDFEEGLDGSKTFRWKIIDDLLDFNILLIENKYTKLLDVLVLSPYHIDAKIDFHNSTSTILGRYRRDIDTYGIMLNTYGNLETLRGILLLNQWLPKMDDSIKLGNIQVLSYLGSSLTMSIADITKNQLPKILSVVKEENEGVVIPNNYKQLELDRFIDPIESVIDQYTRITESYSEDEKELFADGKFQDLFIALEENDKTAKIVALKNLLKYFGTLPQISVLTPEEIIKTARTNSYGADNCRLYITIEKALHHYQGTTPKYDLNLDSIDAKASTTTHVGNENIRAITENAAITFNSIADSVEMWHTLHIREFIRDFLKAKGYNLTRNAIVGDEMSIFNNLYELDDTGRKTMRFKNPFTDGSLNTDELTFLKKTIWTFYLIRNDFRDSLNLGGWNDLKFQDFIYKHPEMLYVPLCRASSSTKVYLNFLKSTWAGRFKRMINVFKNPEQTYYDFVEKVSQREKALYDEDRKHLSISNPFNIGESEDRNAYILEEGIEFFETNVDNLLVEYLYLKVRSEKLKDYMVSTKAFLVEMQLMGESAGKDMFKKQLNYILDFLKVNIYQDSIKDAPGRMITGLLTPLRTLATLINLGGNVISFFRDVFQGLQENFLRGIIKLNTDLQPKYIRDAYAYVITHGMTNTMNIDMLSKLLTKYRLSNIDLASAETLKLGRGGLINYKNWAYSTLRRPDFLNRMTLFVARCMLDGVWGAYSIKNDQLIYDWKKDKRFKALVDGTSNTSTEYKLAKALYMSKIREWNEEHPDKLLPFSPENVEEELPTPYSNADILAIKGLADNIYGAYDKVLKSMMEHGTIMWFFGMYTTWMNGIYSNYFMKPGRYRTTRMLTELEVNESGKPLFWDLNGLMVTTDTGMPVYKNMPAITQGIWYTLKDIYYITEKDGIQAAKEFYKSSPLTRANLKKLLSDFFMCLFMFGILKQFILDPTYKDYKKEMKNNPVLANLGIEVFYKASTRSWDSFQGPYNYINWLFEQNDSPVYEVNTRLIKDAARVLYGDKSLADAVIGSFAFTRMGKDTYSAWKKAQE